MPLNRLPRRDPRTVARDIPGVLDVLFPRLAGALVGSLNKTMFSFEGIVAVPDELIEKSRLQKSMLFELSVARAEELLLGNGLTNWEQNLKTASNRQKQHFDAQIPLSITETDIAAADHAARNLFTMLTSLQNQHPDVLLEKAPLIPGLGWIASGNGDFSLGSLLIEVKHTDRNFQSRDIRQVLIYWLLRYAKSVETDEGVWSNVILLNPRRNAALLINYDYLLQSASAQLNRIELIELLRSAASQDVDRR